MAGSVNPDSHIGNAAHSSWRPLFAFYVVATLTLSLAAAFSIGRHMPQRSIFELQFCVGDTTQHLISGLGISCFEHKFPRPGDILLLRSARMPVATLYATAAALTLGPTHVLAAIMGKTFLMLVPLYLAGGLVFWRCVQSTGHHARWIAILALPFLVPSFLSSVVNMEAEEGFSYAFLALAFALTALGPALRRRLSLRQGIACDLATATALALLYLSKSSMIGVVAIILCVYTVQTPARWRKLLVIALVATAPLAWAVRQHRVSGRYSLGTSWDGSNLYKGNNPEFLMHYPPQPFENLDGYEQEIAPPKPLGTEWAYSDWQKHAAIAYIRSHPLKTMIGWEKKLYVLLFSFRVYGNSAHELPAGITVLGMALLRVLLWTAIGLSGFALLPGRRAARATAFLFLATVFGVLLPYIAGFGFTRHISVLIYPSAVTICLLLSAFQARTSGVTSAQKA